MPDDDIDLRLFLTQSRVKANAIVESRGILRGWVKVRGRSEGDQEEAECKIVLEDKAARRKTRDSQCEGSGGDPKREIREVNC
jgi:hypothetical protein